MAELRPRAAEFVAKGARLAIIGSGWPAMAKDFAAKMHLPPEMTVLTDPKLESYRLAGLRRSALRTLSPIAFFYFLRATFKGFRQGKTKGDSWQQGGSLVIGQGGRVLLRQVSAGPGHHAQPAKLLAALPAPV